MRLFIPITKIDEEKREVYGTLTQEIPDRDDEIFDYDTSKPFFEKWSGYFSEQTGGKSVGNLRAMHKNISAGKLTKIDFNDDEKRIDIVAKVVDDAEWAKCVEGVYTGFSAAGKIVKQWRDGPFRRYTANPYEASLADFPCVPTATFAYMKIGGSVENRGFKKTTETASNDFADIKGQRLRIDTVGHTRASLALWGFAKVRSRYSDDEQDAIGRRLRNGARRHDMLVTEKAVLGGEFAKGLYDVGELARAIEGLSWLQRAARYERENEKDNSPVPDLLLDNISALTQTLQEMTGEECDELLAMLDFESNKTTGEGAVATKLAGESDADFAKRMGKKDKAALDDMHTAASAAHVAMRDAHKSMGVAVKAMGDHCEKLGAFKDAGSGEAKPTEESAKTTGAQTDMENSTETPKTPAPAAAAAAAPTSVEKTEGAGLKVGEVDVVAKIAELETRVVAAEDRATKAEAKAADFEKVAKDLAEAGEQLIAAGGARPGVLKAVSKGSEVAAGGTVEKTAGGEKEAEPTTPRDAFKKSFRSPEIISGVPGSQQ